MSVKKFLALICVTIAVALSGCSTLGTSNAPLNSAIQQPAPQGMYLVDMVPFMGQATSHKGQLRGNMTVQNALEESGALRKFRSLDIELYRIVNGSGRVLKMPVELQGTKKIVKFEQDYALHPGDRIVVKPRSKTGIDSLLNSLIPAE